MSHILYDSYLIPLSSMIVETFLFEIDFFVSCPFFGLGLVDSFEGPLLGMLLLLVFFGRDFEPFFCFSRVDLEKVELKLSILSQFTQNDLRISRRCFLVRTRGR